MHDGNQSTDESAAQIHFHSSFPTRTTHSDFLGNNIFILISNINKHVTFRYCEHFFVEKEGTDINISADSNTLSSCLD